MNSEKNCPIHPLMRGPERPVRCLHVSEGTTLAHAATVAVGKPTEGELHTHIHSFDFLDALASLDLKL